MKSLLWRLRRWRHSQSEKPLMGPHCGVALVWHRGMIVLAGREGCQWLYLVARDGSLLDRKLLLEDAAALLDSTAGKGNWTDTDLILVRRIVDHAGAMHAEDLPIFF